MTTVREIMTGDPECVRADQTLQDAAEIMTRKGVGGLPICGTDNRLKGMLTDRDIVVRAIGAGKSLSTKAGDLSQGEAVTVGADDSTDELLATMTEHRVKRLPVIDGHDLVGIVTMGDVARSLPDPDAGELVEALSVD